MLDTFHDPIKVEEQSRPRTLFGYLELPDGGKHTVWIELSNHDREPSKISCQLKFSTDFPEYFAFRYRSERDLNFVIEYPFAGSLRLSQIGGGTFKDREASFDLGAYDLTESMIPKGSETHVTATLTSKGSLISVSRVVNQNGTIEKHGDDLPPITWLYESIEYSLQMMHGSRTAEDGSARGLLLTQRPMVSCHFDQPADSEPRVILDQTAASLELPLLLFSFLSRQTIEWFDLAIYARTPDGRLIESRRRNDTSLSAFGENPMFSPLELTQGMFAQMLGILEGCEARTDIIRSIRYLLGSYRPDDVDTRFLLAVAALETFVNMLEAEEATEDSSSVDLSVLNQTLFRVIRCYGRKKSIEMKSLQKLQNKIADLNKPSFKAKALHHVERLSVDTSGLWLNHKTAVDQFAAGLAGAYRTRSALIHNTSIRDLGRLVSDLARIQCLLERMVLRLLGEFRPEISNGLVNARYHAMQSESGL